MRPVPAVALAVVLAGIPDAAPLSAQAPRPQAGAIVGRVMVAGGNESIVHAAVTLTPAAAAGVESRSIDTNDRGEFSFEDLPPGRYYVAARKPRFLRLAYGQRVNSALEGLSIVVRSGERITNINIPLPLASVLSGIVTDAQGEPAQGTTVSVWRLEWFDGERVVRQAETDIVDDRGQYRVPGLPPGDYIVSATQGVPGVSSAAQSTAAQWTTTFYPGTLSPALAIPVTVALSEDHGGVNIQLAPDRLGLMRGRVVGADGAPRRDVRVVLSGADKVVSRMTDLSTYSGANGEFTLRNVPPGQHDLLALSEGAGSTEPESARLAFSSDGTDQKDVVIAVRAAATVEGRMVTEGGQPLGVPISLRPVDRSVQGPFVPSARPQSDGRFTVHGVLPGRYLVDVLNLADDQVVTAVTLGGRDIQDVPLDIDVGQALRDLKVTVSARAGSLSGVLLDSSGKPATDFIVIVFAEDPKHWRPGTARIRMDTPDHEGKYTISGLPAGPYRVAVVTDAEPGEWLAPPFLQKLLPASAAVTLALGDPKTLDLRVK